jgi:phosphoglycerol transferase
MKRSETAARPSRTARTLRWLLLTVALVLLALAGWIRYRFGVVTLDQTLLNLRGATGENAGNRELVGEAVVACVVLPVTLAGAALGLLTWRQRRGRTRPVSGVRRHPVLAGAVSVVAALATLLAVTGVPQYASAMLGAASFAGYYEAPVAAPASGHPRNLVTIYLESGENTFADAGLFGRNLLADLDRATVGWTRYDGLEQYPGGGWTMAGIVGTQCGIPLKSELLTPGVDHNLFGEQLDTYLPGARCLGDVLHDAGYTNVYLGGAHSKFAGKGTYLLSHGYDFVYGLENWEADGEDRDNISTWGMSDHRLFGYAAQKVAALHAAGKPFNLTMLTLDTHEPGGVYPTCRTDDAVAMATAITCSMQAVAGFLDDLRVHHYLDDTVVMIVGDHLKATSEGGFYKAELESRPDRTVIFRVWSPDGPQAINRDRADQLSVLPTTLQLLGLGSPDGRAGVGVSLVGSHDLTNTALALPADQYRTLLAAPSADLYRLFWQKP